MATMAKTEPKQTPRPQAAPGNDDHSGRTGPVTGETVRKALETLQKYRAGKAKLDERILENEHWYRLHRDDAADPQRADSGWLFNSLANKHADFMDNFPEANVLPRAADDEQAARQLTGILPVVLEQNDYEQLYSDAGWDKLKYGASCKMVCWDPEKCGGLGDVSIRTVDLLSLFWQPGVTDLQASRNVFHVELLHNDTIRERWPFVEAQDLGGPALARRYQYEQSADTAEMSTVVDWYYRKNGRLHYCKFVGTTVLWASENHPDYAQRGFYDHGLYPFVLDVLYPIKGTPVGFGAIDVMMGSQAAIDRLDKAIVRSADIASRIRFFHRANGGVNLAQYADLGQDFVEVAGGGVGEDDIRQITLSPLPDVYVAVQNNKIAELKEISGNRDYSQGATANGVTAASAIAALQEAGSKLSRDMLKGAYRAFVRECHLVIELMRQFYTAPRCFRLTGDAGSLRFETFSNAALRPQPQPPLGGMAFADRLPVFDVRVVPTKKSTYSRLSQNELAQALYTAGLFRPDLAEQSLIALSMMDFDGREQVMERIQRAAARQQARAAMAAAPVPAAGVPAEGAVPHTGRIGGVQAGEGLAVAALRRAQQVRPEGGQ